MVNVTKESPGGVMSTWYHVLLHLIALLASYTDADKIDGELFRSSIAQVEPVISSMLQPNLTGESQIEKAVDHINSTVLSKTINSTLLNQNASSNENISNPWKIDKDSLDKEIESFNETASKLLREYRPGNYRLEKTMQSFLNYLKSISNHLKTRKGEEFPDLRKLHYLTLHPEKKNAMKGRKCKGNCESMRIPDPDGCLLRTKYDFPVLNQPIYIYNDTLVYPEMWNGSSSISLDSKDSLSIHCTGTKNHLIGGGPSEVIQCLHGINFRLKKDTREFRDFMCSRPSEAQFVRTGKKCSGVNGTLREIGFKAKGWQKLYEVCYNEELKRTYFTRHIIEPLVLNGAEHRSETTPTMHEMDSRQGLRARDPYKKSFQLTAVKTLLGRSDSFNTKDHNLIRGHLTPEGDLIFRSWQQAIHFSFNSAPQWKIISNGLWLAVERKVRILANNIGSTLEITTGTFGTLLLANANNTNVPVYLDHPLNLVSVPKYFWKNVYSTELKGSLTFIVENNPFNQSEPICESHCKNLGWRFKSSGKVGSILCCLSDAVNEISPYIKMASLLPFLPATHT